MMPQSHPCDKSLTCNELNLKTNSTNAEKDRGATLPAIVLTLRSKFKILYPLPLLTFKSWRVIREIKAVLSC